jgi:hypothetical protein
MVRLQYFRPSNLRQADLLTCRRMDNPYLRDLFPVYIRVACRSEFTLASHPVPSSILSQNKDTQKNNLFILEKHIVYIRHAVFDILVSS